MRKFLIYLPLILCFFLNSKKNQAQTDQLFWFVAPEVTDDHWPGNPIIDRGHPTFLRFSNVENYQITVTITQPAGGMDAVVFDIPANSTRSVQFKRMSDDPAFPYNGIDNLDLDSIENKLNNYAFTAPDPGNKGFRGLKIESTGRMTCYYEISGPLNREIMSLKGRNGLGTEFFAPFQHRHPTTSSGSYDLLYSAIDIVATANNTVVTIEPTEDIMLITSGGETSHTGTYTITLEQGETFSVVPFGTGNSDDPTISIGHNIARHKDLSGTRITSTFPISVNVKDDLVSSGSGVDIIADQLVPVTIRDDEGNVIPIVGNDYVVIRNPKFTLAEEYAVIVATDDNTEIFSDNGGGSVSHGILNRGDTLSILITDNTIITSPDSAFYVFHQSGVNYNSVGAQMGGAIIPAITVCTGSYKVSFVRSITDPFFMNVLVRDGGQNNFEIQTPTDTFAVNPANFKEVIPGEWWAASIEYDIDTVPPNVVISLVNNGPNLFHLGILNGNVDCFYGYFSDFNPINVQGSIGQSINTFHRTCYKQDVDLVAYGASTYEWTSEQEPSFLSDPYIPNPTVINPTENRKYKVYGYGDCDMKDSAYVTVQVATPIGARYKRNTVSGCSPYMSEIINYSEEVGPVSWYWWYFGDGTSIQGGSSSDAGKDTVYYEYINNSDTVQNLPVKMVVQNSGFCRDTADFYVTIYPEVKADFDYDIDVGCNPLDVEFINKSTGAPLDDTLRWDLHLGDGSVYADKDTVNYTYAHSNEVDIVNYTAWLEAYTKNCRDTFEHVISVYPYLEAGFAIDKVEGCSPLDVSFTNISKGEDSLVLVYGDGDTLKTNTFASLTHQYTNLTATVDTNIVELIVYNDENCTRTQIDTVIVFPQVTAAYSFLDDPGVKTGCNTRNVIFQNNSTNGWRYFWTMGDGTNMDTTDVDIAHLYENKTVNDKEYIFNLIARTQYGCRDTIIDTLTIYRAYADFTVSANEDCSPLVVGVNNVSVGNTISTWNWDYGDGYTPTIEDPAPHTYRNTGFEADTNNLVLEVTGTAGCSSRDSATIIVHPQIKIDYSTGIPSVKSCDSLPVQFNLNLYNALLPNVSYSWFFGDGGSSDVSSPIHVYKNLNSDTTIDRTVSLHVETEYGCSYDTSSIIAVDPFVDANIIIDKNNGCSPLTVDVTAQNFIGIRDYNWEYGHGPTDNVRNPLPHLYPDNNNRTLGGDDVYDLVLNVVDVSGNCTDTDTVEVTVYSDIVADINPKNETGCNPLTVNFTDNSSANASDWEWTFGDGTFDSQQNVSHKYTNMGISDSTFNVELVAISDRGCSDTTTTQVTVYPYIDADFDINVSEGCSPLTVTISNNSSATDYYWFWDDASLNIGSPDHATSNPGTHTYINTDPAGTSRTDSLTLIVSNGHNCYDTLKRAITVHASIVAGFNFNQPDPCTDSDVAFNSNTTVPLNTPYGSITYNWDFNDGSNTSTTANVVNHTFENSDTLDKAFNVRMIARTPKGCRDTAFQTVTVYSRVTADFYIPDFQDCPNPTTAMFTTSAVNTSIGDVTTNTYQWYVDNTLISTLNDRSDFVHSYHNNTTNIQEYGIKLIATNSHGCSTEKLDTVRVLEYVQAGFSMDKNEGCSPLDIEFTNTSSIPANSKIKWNFGDGSTSEITTSPFSNEFFNNSTTTDKPYTVQLVVQSPNLCSDTIEHGVLVWYTPQAQFSLTKTSDCPPLVTQMTNESIGDDVFEWRFGDGATNVINSTIEHTYDNPEIADITKTYILELWVASGNGCKDSTNTELKVFPKVIADFDFTADTYCSPAEVTFTNKSSAAADDYYWNFDDGGATSKEENPFRILENSWNDDKDFNVYLKATSAGDKCWDDTTIAVRVYVQPNAEFDISPIVQKFPNNRVLIDNKTNMGPFDYLWEFGDRNITTSTDQEPNFFEYEHWGEKDIKLTVTSQTNNCTDDYLKTATILPPDINAAFTVDRDKGCLNDGFVVNFTAAASVYSEVYEYKWDFNDGYTGEGQTIAHTFEETGTYHVKLTAYGEGGEDYEYQDIKVYPNPKANFTVMPRRAEINASTLEALVKFDNLSQCNDTSGCSYEWRFGDGTNAISRDVTHAYTELGKYDIQLFATNSAGCKDSLLLPEEVEVIGTGEINYPNAFTPNGDGNNDVFRPVSSGVIQYELLIYNRWGELIFKTNNLGEGWDGKVNGQLAKPDVYVWRAEGKFTSGRAFDIAGDVTLIR